jgi:predicted nucleic acid-binding protein
MDLADQDHEVCVTFFESRAEPLVVPAPVLVELAWLALSRLGLEPFEALLADISDGSVWVIDLTRDDYERVSELLRRYSDLPLDFVDAAVLAVVERLGERELVTLDHRHFSIVRPRHVASLTLNPSIT